jgi:2-polyprenyl-3-methyl-5-hydroxy-6-metoxy-1,4-benzoquinol methylase
MVESEVYGWTNATAEESHQYLLPALLRELGDIESDRPVRVLDLGCGNGSLSARLASSGHSVVGVDVSRDGIEIASEAYPAVDFRLASIYDADLAGAGFGFDWVVSLEVIEHLFYPSRLFQQAWARLRPGGYFLLSTPYHGYVKNLALSVLNGWDNHFRVERDGGHIKFFSNAKLRAMAREQGFRDIRFRGAGRMPLLWKSTVLIARKPLSRNDS